MRGERGGICGRWRRFLGESITTVGSIAALTAGCGSQVAGGDRAAARSSVRSAVSMLAEAPNYAYPAIAPDASNGFSVVWGGDAGVMSAHLSAPGRTWSTPSRLAGRIAEQPGVQLAGSPSGAAAVVWANGSTGVAQARYRIADGAWERTATLFSSRRWAVSNPEVGVDDRGDAFAVWQVGNGAIDVAEHPASADSWLPPTTLVKNPRAGLLGFAVGASGTLALAWTRSVAGGIQGSGRSQLYVSVRPAGQATWRSARQLGAAGTEMLQNDGPPPFLSGPQVAVDTRGSVFVVWQWPHLGTFYPRVGLLTATGHGYRSRTVSLPRSGLDPVIATDQEGSATVLWERPQNIDSDIWEADISPRGRALGVHRMGHGSDAMVAMDDRGDLVASWSGPDRVAVRPAGRRWCPQISLQGEGDAEPPRVAIASNGVAQIVWQQGSDTKTETALYARTVTRCR